ncbi:Crp/Fnr family transcriptional regulator [Pseudoduganella sp. RAF53_2]|uniref:Crp/Fnr family transcriptional regulator n=1 Tax=unclassified Pseudoduganella TaxID=2637179 RepID=UPI003F94CEA3
MATPFLTHRAELRDTVAQKLGIAGDLYDCYTRLLHDAAQTPFRKGDYLQRAGEPAQDFFWLGSGIVRRGYFSAEGEDITLGFMCAGDNSGSYSDLQAGRDGLPAREFFIAETAVVGYRISWARLQELLAKHSCAQGYLEKVMERAVGRYAQNLRILALPSASERLDAFREVYPGLEPLISQRALASFLGVTTQYMSQLKRTV